MGSYVSVFVANLLVGGCIGLTGIAGFLLPIFYVGALGLAPVEALALSFAAFLVSGVLGTPAYRATGNLPTRETALLAAGSLVGALAGVRVGLLLPAQVLTALLYVVVLCSGVSVLVRMRPRRGSGEGAGSGAGESPGVGGGDARLGAGGAAARLEAGDAAAWPEAGDGPGFRLADAGGPVSRPAAAYVLIGVATAVICAATGAGGPVLVVPILMLLGLSPRSAVGVGLADSVAIAVPSAVGYLVGGGVFSAVWALLPAALVGHAVGAVLGSRNAHRIDAGVLKAIVAVGSVAVALYKLVPMLL